MIERLIYILRKIKFNFKQTSYSQAGEDSIVRYLFNDYGKKRITYLDLGTNDPCFGNNTYWFYRNKSRGVCIEADQTLISKIKIFRPKDKVINAGVTFNDLKSADFFIFNESAINTFDFNEAEIRSKSGKYTLLRTVKVPLLTINEIIENNFDEYPDFLSIDIEGFDFSVLQSLNITKFPIPVICVETCTYSENHIRPKDNNIENFMKTIGYEIYADTYLNTIFVNSKWFSKIK